jgi:hypothetical protein
VCVCVCVCLFIIYLFFNFLLLLSPPPHDVGGREGYEMKVKSLITSVSPCVWTNILFYMSVEHVGVSYKMSSYWAVP